MGYDTIQVQPCSPNLGADISGIDLGSALGNQTFDELQRALLEHQVIFFRDQDITPEQHLAFGRRFGELNVHPFSPSAPDHPEILLLENDEDNPPVVNVWHTDVTFMQRPALGSILRAVDVPDAGGDTIWASMTAAFDGLSDKIQRLLSGLVAVHDFEHVFFKGGQFGSRKHKDAHEMVDKIARARERYPLAEHPVIRTHPETGQQAIFVNPVFTTGIKDMNPREGRALLEFLYQHVTTPAFQVRFRWRKNSVAFWDNRSTQHYAVGDYWPQRRLMHRVTIEGDKPFYRA